MESIESVELIGPMELIEEPIQVDSPKSAKDDSSSDDSSLRNEIITLIKDKKKLSDSSIEVYLRNLRKLNSNKTLTDNEFKFLDDAEAIMTKLECFKETTKRNYLISIVSILSLYPNLKSLHDVYHALMMTKKAEINEIQSTGTRSDTQEENWVDWDCVKEHHKLLGEKVDVFYKKKTLPPEDFLILTAYMILSLYVLIPPRRNKDYCVMRVVNTFTPGEIHCPAYNYYDTLKKKFIFNNYKTSKKYGRFDIQVTRALQTVINKYLKHRLYKFPVDDNDNKPFLIKPDGSPLDKSNDITKILNKVFGKAIGSTMLRHIFLTDKYSTVFKTAKIDAEKMGHSETEQKKYIKDKLTVVV